MLSYVDAEIVQPLEKAQITNSTMASDKKKKKKKTSRLRPDTDRRQVHLAYLSEPV